MPTAFKKRKNLKESTAPLCESKENDIKKEPTDVPLLGVPKDGPDLYENLGQYYQANSQQMMRHMGQSALQAMMGENSAKSSTGGNNPVENMPGSHMLGSNKSGILLPGAMSVGNINPDKSSADFNFMGMPGGMPGYPFHGMGIGGGSGNHGSETAAVTGSNNNDFNSSQTPDSYRDFFKNMRNYFPGLGAGPAGGGGGAPPSVGGQGSIPEDFQRMMLARAMGQSAGMHPASMGSMMGVGNPSSSLNPDNPFSNGLTNPKKESRIEQLENLKSMMQNGLDRSIGGGAPPGIEIPMPTNLPPGQISPSTLNMIRATGQFSSQGSAANAGGGGSVTHDQLAGMIGGDRLGQQLYALQGSHPFAGLNHLSGLSGPFDGFDGGGGRGVEGAAGRGAFRRPGSLPQASLSDQQQAYLQSFTGGQVANRPSGPSGGGGAGGAYGNPALDDIAKFFGMSGSSAPQSSARNPGKNNGEKE